jgi:hypothetical protein
VACREVDRGEAGANLAMATRAAKTRKLWQSRGLPAYPAGSPW